MSVEAIKEKKLNRAVVVSHRHGWSIAGFAGLCTLVVLFMNDWAGVVVGTLVTLCGMMEIHGSKLLKARQKNSIAWLCLGEAFLFFVLWVYCALQIQAFDPANPWGEISDGTKSLLLSVNPDQALVEELISFMYRALYFVMLGVVLIYQGGFCIYYYTRKKLLVGEAK